MRPVNLQFQVQKNILTEYILTFGDINKKIFCFSNGLLNFRRIFTVYVTKHSLITNTKYQFCKIIFYMMSYTACKKCIIYTRMSVPHTHRCQHVSQYG